MTSKVYSIFPVANGFIVQIPFSEINDTAEGMAKVLGQFMPPQNDIEALLGASGRIDKPANNKDEYTFIFQELEHALAFLQKRLSE